jgi:hypothetical protein
MELHRIGFKLRVDGDVSTPLTDYIPVFHRWIQEQLLEDLLVDVADYSHVHEGPGIVLVAHQGNYAMDEAGGRRGLAYYSKHALEGSVSARIATVCRKALVACRLLEQETGPARTRFSGGALEVFSNDRLAAPNSDETLSALRPALDELTAKLYPGGTCTFEREPDEGERFSVRISCNESPSTEEMLDRLATSRESRLARSL